MKLLKKDTNRNIAISKDGSPQLLQGVRKIIRFFQSLCIVLLEVEFTNISFHNKQKAVDMGRYRKWLNTTFMTKMYAGEWYNGRTESLENYIGNKHSILLGMPRLRQLRIHEGTRITSQEILVAFCGVVFCSCFNCMLRALLSNLIQFNSPFFSVVTA